MTNQEIAKILREMAIFYEMDNVLFKPRAYTGGPRRGGIGRGGGRYL